MWKAETHKEKDELGILKLNPTIQFILNNHKVRNHTIHHTITFSTTLA
jgi:hypothetical protein